MRCSLVGAARRELPAALKQQRSDKKAHDEEKLLRREEAIQTQLDRVIDKYAAALELYDQWKAQGVKTAKALDELLQPLSANDKVAELRRQIELRTVGLGWAQFATKWTFYNDERAHTTELLRRMLLDLRHSSARVRWQCECVLVRVRVVSSRRVS